MVPFRVRVPGAVNVPMEAAVKPDGGLCGGCEARMVDCEEELAEQVWGDVSVAEVVQDVWEALKQSGLVLVPVGEVVPGSK